MQNNIKSIGYINNIRAQKSKDCARVSDPKINFFIPKITSSLVKITNSC